MKRLMVTFTGVVLGAALGVAPALTGTRHVAVPSKSMITIRHQLRGCHTWSVNGGTYRAALKTTLARGGTIVFVNNDVMPHKLVRTSGPAVRHIGRLAMSHMSASVRVTFPNAGVYRFVTKPGEDYAGMHMKTIGEDNVLRLTVRVS